MRGTFSALQRLTSGIALRTRRITTRASVSAARDRRHPIVTKLRYDQFRCIERLLRSSSFGQTRSVMRTLNANNLQHVSISPNVLRAHKRSSAMRSGVDRTKAIAAPERMQEQQQDTIRLLDLDNAEQSRLEQTDAFKELVALNRQKQSVNRPQKVRSLWRHAARSARNPVKLCKLLAGREARLPPESHVR